MRLTGLTMAGVLAVTAATHAAVDNLSLVVPRNLAVPTNETGTSFLAIGAFGYAANTGKFYSVSFGTTQTQDIREIDSTIPKATTLVSQPTLYRFTKGGDPAIYSGGAATPSGLLLNPKPLLDGNGVEVVPAYGTAIVADGAAVVSTGTGASLIRYPEKSQRIYRLDLFKFANGTVPTPAPPETPALVSLVTTANLNAVNPGQTGSASTGTNRQTAFSSDGQSVYIADSSAAYGGLYRVPALGGPIVKVSADGGDYNTEPAVVNVNGVDRVYLRGSGPTASAGPANNTNGIDYIDTMTGTRNVAVSAAALQGFFESTAAVTTFSMTTDSDNNVYFNNTSSAANGNGGVYRLDTQGRIVKIIGLNERRAYVTAAGGGNANSNTLRMQVRDVPAGTNGSPFAVKQLMYAENALNGITGITLYKTGDFNRDDAVNAVDTQLLGSKLTVRGVKSTVAEDLKFDLNGNDTIDFRDVKTLQQFVGFADGDANLSLTLNLLDIDVLRDNYNQLARTFVQGDLNGTNATDFGDLSLLAVSWVGMMAAPTDAELEANYTGAFLTDTKLAFSLAAVPEPTALAGMAVLGGLALRRRNRR